jgi:hypothetical protein
MVQAGGSSGSISTLRVVETAKAKGQNRIVPRHFRPRLINFLAALIGVGDEKRQKV